MKFFQSFHRDLILIGICTILISTFVFAKDPQPSQSSKNHPVDEPFFLMGDGKLKIKNISNGRYTEVSLLKKDGSLNSDGFTKIDYVFGFPTTSKGENISYRMLFMLDHFSDHFAPGKTVYLKSGYRSPKYNKNLRDQGRTAAKTSTHIDGMAIDFYIDGVDGKVMWEYIRVQDCCGTGHYGGKTVHLDSGRPRFWEQATSKVRTGASDFNRYIYLSTEYDRYKPGQKIRLLFTSISDFGFGVKPQITYVTDKDGEDKVAKGKLISEKKSKCLMVTQRNHARFIYTTIPEKLEPGRYRIKVDFCKRPFEEMPEIKVTNEIEIL